MDLATINRMASQDASSYEGDNTRGRYYTGFADDFVDFDGQGLDFARSIQANRNYTITISNTTGSDKVAILCPSYAPNTPAGTYVIVEGAMVANFTATGSPRSIAEFLAWININPTHVPVMRIQSNVAAQLQQTMKIVRKSPFKVLQDDSINIGSFVSETNNNDKLVTVNRPFQLDNQTEISIIIPSTAVTVFTFFCGAVLNTAAALNTKFAKAAQTAGATV